MRFFAALLFVLGIVLMGLGALGLGMTLAGGYDILFNIAFLPMIGIGWAIIQRVIKFGDDYD